MKIGHNGMLSSRLCGALLLIVAAILVTTAAPVSAYEITGVEAYALDHPRVPAWLKAPDAEEPLSAQSEFFNRRLFAFDCFLDTGASRIVLSKKDREALGVKATEETVEDWGIGGTETFDVSEPYILYVGDSGANIMDPASFNFRMEVKLELRRKGMSLSGALPEGMKEQLEEQTGGLGIDLNQMMEDMMPGVNVLGTPFLEKHVVVLDPRPVAQAYNMLLGMLGGLQGGAWGGATGQEPGAGTQDEPGDEARDRPFGHAQDRPFGQAQDRPFGHAQDRPFGHAQDKPFGGTQGQQDPMAALDQLLKQMEEMDASGLGLGMGSLGRMKVDILPAGAPAPQTEFSVPLDLRRMEKEENLPVTNAPIPFIENALLKAGEREVKADLIVDTGGAVSIISTDLAERLGFDLEQPEMTTLIMGVGDEGAVELKGFRLDSLTLPTKEGEPIVFMGAPMFVADIEGVDATLGANLLAPSVHVNMDALMGGMRGAQGLSAALGMLDQMKPGVMPFRRIVIDLPGRRLGLDPARPAAEQPTDTPEADTRPKTL